MLTNITVSVELLPDQNENFCCHELGALTNIAVLVECQGYTDQDENVCLLSALGAVTNNTVSVQHMIMLCHVHYCTMDYYWARTKYMFIT